MKKTATEKNERLERAGGITHSVQCMRERSRKAITGGLLQRFSRKRAGIAGGARQSARYQIFPPPRLLRVVNTLPRPAGGHGSPSGWRDAVNAKKKKKIFFLQVSGIENFGLVST